jgi:hypothetical protein
MKEAEVHRDVDLCAPQVSAELDRHRHLTYREITVDLHRWLAEAVAGRVRGSHGLRPLDVLGNRAVEPAGLDSRLGMTAAGSTSPGRAPPAPE